MSPTLVQSRWRMDGRVLRSGRYHRHHRTFINHCSSLPPGCYDQCAVHRGVRRNHRRRERKIRTDGREARKRFLVDAIFNEHHRYAHSGRKQRSRKEGCTNIEKRPAGRFVAGLLLSRRICLRISFSRTPHAREWKMRPLSLPSSMSRARARRSPISRRSRILFLALFLFIFLSLSLAHSISPQFLAFLLFPTSMNVYATYFSRINRPDVHTHARAYVRITTER